MNTMIVTMRTPFENSVVDVWTIGYFYRICNDELYSIAFLREGIAGAGCAVQISYSVGFLGTTKTGVVDD